MLRGVEGTFSEHTMPTIGAFYLTKHEEVDAAPVSLLLWDTAGQEHYRCAGKPRLAVAIAKLARI